MRKVVNPTADRLALAYRFFRYISEEENGCTTWIGFKAKDGYGRITLVINGKRRPKLAHRIGFDLFVGEIHPGHQIHHRCQNRSCVNPDHLEALTRNEHLSRHPEVRIAKNAMRLRCDKGHEYVSVNGRRFCRDCARAYKLQWLKDNPEKARLASARWKTKRKAETQTP